MRSIPLFLILLSHSITFALDLRKVTSEYKDASYYTQQIGEAMISQFRQKIMEMTQSYQMKGTQKDLQFITFEAKGCLHLVNGNEEVVTKIRYTFVPAGIGSVFQSERLTYYGCQDKQLFSELIQVENPTSTLNPIDITTVRRNFTVQPGEKRRVYRIFYGQEDDEIISIDSSFDSSQNWLRVTMRIKQLLIMTLYSWADASGNKFTKMTKHPYSYFIQIENSTIDVVAETTMNFKISQLPTGVRYSIENNIRSRADFDSEMQNTLFSTIGGQRFGKIVTKLSELFPLSKPAPKFSQMEKQLDEAKILLESKLDPEKVLSIVKDLLDGVRSGKIIDNRGN